MQTARIKLDDSIGALNKKSNGFEQLWQLRLTQFLKKL
jgi:hypothetical protein